MERTFLCSQNFTLPRWIDMISPPPLNKHSVVCLNIMWYVICSFYRRCKRLFARKLFNTQKPAKAHEKSKWSLLDLHSIGVNELFHIVMDDVSHVRNNYGNKSTHGDLHKSASGAIDCRIWIKRHNRNWIIFNKYWSLYRRDWHQSVLRIWKIRGKLALKLLST